MQQLGRDTSITGMASDMQETETMWVKKAEASSTDNNNPDMIVTVVDGYAYQVYYDSTYGVVFTEYIGKDDGKGFPNLKTEYSKKHITGTASAGNGDSIKSVELIYKGEVKKSNTSGDVDFSVEEGSTGWYIVKVTTDSGKMRYNWIRVSTTSSRLTAPTIAVTPLAGPSGWYNEKSEDVKVTIKANSKDATGIKYWKSTDLVSSPDEDGTTEEKTETSFTLSVEGTTTITAVELDSAGLESTNKATATVRIDKTKPETKITQKVNGNEEEIKKEEPKGWYKDNVEVKTTVTDGGSGPDGYEYLEKQENTDLENAGNTWIKNKQEGIMFSTEGEKTVAIRGLDVAGNTSEITTVTIRIDKTAPNFTEDLKITDISTTSFKVTANAADDLSGNTKYGGKITYKCTVTDKSTNEKKVDGVTNETGIFEVTGLKANGNYEIMVEATDLAR